ncbi:conserved protein of unknown function [Tenacibaculum maritimum NCIMB 2154]|uniref:Uncharacterized protein n=2 Tax=Tenacibaculum maritimum TaxID=107401 RepID=A0A2H1ECZ3_9FLAO|nr:conserved hypothetical protein [Tenacibaculum maritimum]SFZ84404.1 conserved protein of unknown function [Tenacibaculum maritimum NCIMB 2154]
MWIEINFMEKIKQQRILDNKNDLIENTFCFELFENRIFNKSKCIDLINDAKYLKKHNLLNSSLLEVLEWITLSVEQCFISNKDITDLYKISNYQKEYELDWNLKWKKEIQEIIN